MKTIIERGILLIAMMLILGGIVYAASTDPTGPSSITRVNDSTMDTDNYLAITIQAEAGNITMLNISAVAQTQAWQGYYGEISGTITLDDAQNNTMYDWGLAEPQGEIYASNTSTVTWANIRCVNFTGLGPSGDSNVSENITILEDAYSIADDDKDGINETFSEVGLLSDNSTSHPAIYVGQYLIPSGNCPAMDTYESDGVAGTNFTEVMLTDNQSIVYTTIIEDDEGGDTDLAGFDGSTHDFQLMVPEDGHNGSTGTTPYYFFVEIS